MSKKILVTGGCGYIGSILVPMLLDRGYGVRVFDKLYFGDEALKSTRDKIEFIAGDVRYFDPAILDGVDAVIHLGSLSNDPTAAFDPVATRTINYEGSIKLARAAKARGIERFTFASTCAIYGFHLEGIADETFPANPQTDYAQSKIDTDLELEKMADAIFCPVILRQATVVGYSPRMRWDLVVNAFVMHAFKTGRLDVWFGGEAWRPIVNVRDTAEAHIRCIEAPADKVRGQVFNVVQQNYRILELAHRVRRALGELGIPVEVDVNYDQTDNRSYRTNGEKLGRVVGFTPSITIEETVKEIAELLRSGRYRDFEHPIYYNMRWMKLLVEVEDRLNRTGKVF